jgi:NifB/MoaA-like Fe-S oxidoreductase
MTCWNVDTKTNEMFMMKCMNPRCATGHIIDDYVACPDCGENNVHITKHVHDLDTMGISETRMFEPSRDIELTDGSTTFGCVVFEPMNDDKTMPTITLAKKFASNAKKIRVTVDIIE